jgi:hypothetical protein
MAARGHRFRDAAHQRSFLEPSEQPLTHDLRNEANKSFAINETTIMLRRMLRPNRRAR